MTGDEYQRLAARTINGGSYQHDAEKHALTNATLGLAGETGEIVELVKKHLYHGKAIDDAKLMDEASDLAWYLAAVLTSRGLSLSSCMEHNIAKLKARYPCGFVEGGGMR